MAALTKTEANERVTRDDIESKLRAIRGDVADVGSASKVYVLAAGVVAMSALVGAAYLFGHRRGRRRRTIVEVRRV